MAQSAARSLRLPRPVRSPWMVERVSQQNLPNNPDIYDAELAATLTKIVWGALYLKPMPS